MLRCGQENKYHKYESENYCQLLSLHYACWRIISATNQTFYWLDTNNYCDYFAGDVAFIQTLKMLR
jgi:hypothetical protein